MYFISYQFHMIFGNEQFFNGVLNTRHSEINNVKLKSIWTSLNFIVRLPVKMVILGIEFKIFFKIAIPSTVPLIIYTIFSRSERVQIGS